MTGAPRKRSSLEPVEALLGRDSEALSVPLTRRPASTTLGAVLVFARAAAGLLWLAAYALLWREAGAELQLDVEDSRVLLWVVLICGGLGVLVLVLFAWLVWRGSNFARIVTMSSLTLSIAAAAIGYFASGQQITVRTSLLTVALDILVLLALSSRQSRAWARGSGAAAGSPGALPEEIRAQGG